MSASKSIFLVDDDKILVYLTIRAIKSALADTTFKDFANGLEAIDYLRSVAGQAELLPDIILLDLSMPVMDGWEFLDQYSQFEPLMTKKSKLYIFSSSISPHDIERAKNINLVSDFIIKPLKKEKVLEMVNLC